MRRALVALLVVCLAADLAIAVAIGVTALSNRRWMIEAREALFADVTDDATALAAPPAELVGAGFKTDPPELVAEWKERLPREVAWLEGVPERLAGRTELEKIQALVPLFSKNGGGGCGDYRDLLDNVQRLPRGEGLGCCSDHVQVLIALGAPFGFTARQIQIARHTIAEVFVPELSKWVFVDPHYAVMAREPNGGWLSFAELRARSLAGEPVAWQFIGNEHHRFAQADPGRSELYGDPDDFAVMKVVWGNNVFEEDRLDRRLAPLPRSVRQLVGFLTDVLPRTALVQDEHAPRVPALQRHRGAVLAAAALLAAGTLLPLVLLRRQQPAPRGPRASRDEQAA